MPQYQVQTVAGLVNVTADRYRKDDHGDLQFYNGSRDTPPVREFIRENTVGIAPRRVS